MTNRITKIFLFLIIGAVLIAGMLGCSSPASQTAATSPAATSPATTAAATTAPATTAAATTTAPAPTPEATTKTVIDHLDRTVEVPANPQRVMSLHAISTEIVYCLQAQDKLIAIDPYSPSLPISSKIDADMKNKTAMRATFGLNVEEILEQKPDLVIAAAYYPDEIKVMAESGITVIAFDFHGRTTNEEIELIGAALGKEAEAETLIAYRNAREKEIYDIVATIPLAERKAVFYLRYSISALKTATANAFENHLIEGAGGINLGGDITTGSWAEISWEQLLDWNPGIIISAPVIGDGTFITMDELKADSRWNSVKAIQDDNAWVMPMGYFKMDCSAPENILGLEYLAKKLYPDKFSGLDLEEDIRDFFETFYHYSLSDEEMENILNQQGLEMGS